MFRKSRVVILHDRADSKAGLLRGRYTIRLIYCEIIFQKSSAQMKPGVPLRHSFRNLWQRLNTAEKSRMEYLANNRERHNVNGDYLQR